MKQRISAILLCLAMCLTAMPTVAFAADSSRIDYLALGDSISTGNGLTTPTSESFPYLLAAERGYELTNFAADGNTAAGILAQLGFDAVKRAVENADLITITAGGNDLVYALYQAIADWYNAQYGLTGDHTVSGSDIAAALAGNNPNLSFTAIDTIAVLGIVSGFSASDAFKNTLNSYTTNMFGDGGVIHTILALNPNVTIVVATQYNPYAVFKDTLLYGTIYTSIEAGVLALNQVIHDNASGRCIVADVYAAFAASSEHLCNAGIVNGALNLDFHPNAAGHRAIADAIPAYGTPVSTFAVNAFCASSRGTVTGGGTYEAGAPVALTATPDEAAVFRYWVDADIAASWRGAPAEAELRAAIVSYDAAYTFKAAKNVRLEAVFSPPAEIPVVPMLITGTDESSLLNAARMDAASDFGSVIPGPEQIILPGEAVDEVITVGERQYRFAGFLNFRYCEATDTKTVDLTETFTVDAMPLYGSAEWRSWFAPISDGVFAAYLPYTPEVPENPDRREPGEGSNMELWFSLLFLGSGTVITLTVCDRKKKKL